jgi:LacI family transcriptional regulator
VLKPCLTIGFLGDALQESVGRPFGGALRFAKEHPGTVLNDYCELNNELDFDLDQESPPPWTGAVDGMLLSTGYSGDPQTRVDWILRGAVPAVSVAADMLDARLPAVFTDPASIARLAVEHLLACGCRRLVHVGFRESMGSRRRWAALQAAAQAAGVPVAEHDLSARLTDVRRKDVSSAEEEGIDRLLRKSPRPVGVLALNDPTARYVWQRCVALALDVPGDVAIVGVDDSPVAFGRKPTLTSIRYPGEEVGYRAMELLTSLIGGGRRPHKPILIPATQLIVRQSTGGRDTPDDDVAMALEMIHRQANTGLRIDDLLDSAAISRRSLELAFQKKLGRSPAAEVRRLRLAYAKELLLRTTLSIMRIAAAVGFSEQASFNKFFRANTGLTPSRFRAQHRRHG